MPAIDGLWQIGNVASNKGESAWRFIVRQSGAEVTAAILRVDGDTGALAGTLSQRQVHRQPLLGRAAAGARADAAEGRHPRDPAQPHREDDRGQGGRRKLKDVPEPTDPSRHSSVKNPTEPFKFAFPDINGKLVSSTDERFRGKVVIVGIGGSWCPNCHDEAPFLAELYDEVPRQGPRDRRALVRRGGAEGQGLSAAARVQQALRRGLPGAARRAIRRMLRRRCRRSTT